MLWKLEPYQFFHLASNKKPKNSLPRKKVNKYFFIDYFYSAIWAENWNSKPCNWGTLKYFEKKWKLKWKISSESTKNQRCSKLFQRQSALFGADFAALKTWFLSSDQSWISALQRLSGNVQRWIRTETTVIISESSASSTRVVIVSVHILETEIMRKAMLWKQKYPGRPVDRSLLEA